MPGSRCGKRLDLLNQTGIAPNSGIFDRKHVMHNPGTRFLIPSYESLAHLVQVRKRER